MKAVILLLAILLISVYAQERCRVYKCGDIAPDQDGEFCVQRSGEDDSTWHAQTCPDHIPFCQVEDFENPLGSPETAVCGETTPDFDFEFVSTPGAGLDGDYCLQDSDCLNADQNLASCIDNVCLTSKRIGDSCSEPYGDDCPRDTFCNLDRKCSPAVKAGDECKMTDECEMNHECAFVMGKTEGLVCIPLFSLKNGDTFVDWYKYDMEIDPNARVNSWESYSTLCESTHHVQYSDPKLQCRSPDRNVDQSLSTEFSGEACVIEIFMENDLDKYNVPSTKVYESICGFNKDSRAWCPLMTGDDYAIDLFKSSEKLRTESHCHKRTWANPSYGSICAEIYQSFLNGEEAFFDLFRYYRIVTEFSHQGWANIANNDECVKDTITYPLWRRPGENYSPDGFLKSSY